MSDFELLLTAWLQGGTIPADFKPSSNIEEYLLAILNGVDDNVDPKSRADVLLDAIATKYAGFADGLEELRGVTGMTAHHVPGGDTPEEVAAFLRAINNTALQDLAAKGATGVANNTTDILWAYEDLPSGGLRDELLAGLPHNQNIVAWFDSNEGVGTTEWKDLIGANIIQLFSPTITGDGAVRVEGTETEYAKLTIGSETADTLLTAPRTTYYILRKAPQTSYAVDWQSVVSCETGTGDNSSTWAAAADGKMKFLRPYYESQLQTYENWHVLATRTARGGSNYPYVDGTALDHNTSSVQATGYSSTMYFGRGKSWYYTGTDGAIELLAVLVFAEVQTAEQVAANSQWLREHYITQA